MPGSFQRARDRREDRHARRPATLEARAVAPPLLAHVAQRVLRAAAVGLVQHDEVGEVEHVDLLELRRRAVLGRHHVDREVDAGRRSRSRSGRCPPSRPGAGRSRRPGARAARRPTRAREREVRAARRERAHEDPRRRGSRSCGCGRRAARRPCAGASGRRAGARSRRSGWSSRKRRTSSSTTLDLPAPPVPVKPTTGRAARAPRAPRARARSAASSGVAAPPRSSSQLIARAIATGSPGESRGEQRRPAPRERAAAALVEEAADHALEAERAAVLGAEDARDAVAPRARAPPRGVIVPPPPPYTRT